MTRWEPIVPFALVLQHLKSCVAAIVRQVPIAEILTVVTNSNPPKVQMVC
jgi:hypothetical protein